MPLNLNVCLQILIKMFAPVNFITVFKFDPRVEKYAVYSTVLSKKLISNVLNFVYETITHKI